MISILKMEKKYVKLSKNGYINMVLVLLSIHIVNGAVVYSTSGSTYFGDSLVVTFTISPSFTTSATVSQDSILRSSCIPTVCGPNLHNNITFTPSSTKITLTFNPVLSSQKGDWQCLVDTGELAIFPFNPTSAPRVVTTEGTREGASTCDGNLRFCHLKSCLLFAVLCFIAPILKIVIILRLWYKCRNCKRIPEDTYIRIIVTAQKKITKASQWINNEDEQDISLCNPCHEIIILVRAGVKIQCSFQVDGNEFILSFGITEDMLNAGPGKMIKLPTMLQVHPKYETIQWSFNRKELDCKDQYYKTKVSLASYGVYDIEMKFLKQVMISIQNMRVQGCYWKLMILFFVIDIVLAVICGTVTGLKRLDDGFCVKVIVIICVVLISWIFFTGVEMALIYFKLIKRTESKEGSGSQDSDMVKIKTSETRTGSPNAETTTFSTRTGSPKLETTTFTADGLSSSDVTATTKEGQNSREWQPPN